MVSTAVSGRPQFDSSSRMDKNKRAQEEDHEQLVQLLKELKDDKKEVRQIVTETNGQVAEVLQIGRAHV